MDKYFYVCKGPLIGGKPYNNVQGIHMATNIDACEDLAVNIREYEDPHYYEIHTRNLVPLHFDIDPGFWDAKNICILLLENKNSIPDLSVYEYHQVCEFSNKKNGASTIDDLQQVENIFRNHGYNSISYDNDFEQTNEVCYMLFNNDLITKCVEIIVEEHVNE